LGESLFKASPGKKCFRKLGVVVCGCDPSYVRSINGRIAVQAGPKNKCEILFEK
jgi:hypothetical protein